MRFVSPSDGSVYAQPASNPNPGDDTNGIVALVGSNAIGIVGGELPNFPTNSLGTFNADGTFRAEYTGSHASGKGCARDDNDGFYSAKVNGANVEITRYDADATETDFWSVAHGLSFPSLRAMGVNGAGTIAYIGTGPFSGPYTTADVYAVDLAGAGSWLGVFASISSTFGPQEFSENAIIGLTSGDVIVAYKEANIVRRYNSSGSTQATYSLAGAASPIELTHGASSTSFWVNAYSSATTFSGVTIYEVRVSDGTVLNSFDPEDGTFEFDSPFAVIGEAIGVETPTTPSGIPLPTPSAPQTDCAPQSQTSTAVKGQAGCNYGGKGFVLEYLGDWGSVPVHPDPPEHERLTGKDRLTVEAWIEVNTEDYPSGDAVQLLRAHVPLADDSTYEGGSKADGLLAIGDVEHALGNEQGGFEATTVDVQISGAHDSTIHTDADDQDFGGAELIVKLASDAARAAHINPLILMRAIIQQLSFKSHKLVSVKGLDQLFSDSGVFGPTAKFPHKTYGDLGRACPQMTEDVKALPIVPLLGEKTDNGAVNPTTGAVNPKGLIPGVFLGKFLVSGLPTPAATTGRTLAEAVALMQGLVDTDADDATWESTLGFDIGSSDIVNLKAMGTVPNTQHSLEAVIGIADLEEVLRHGTTAAPTDGEYGILAFGYGPWYAFTEVEGSDLGGGVAENKHDRTLLDFVARAGSDMLVPGDGVCPWTAFTLTNPDTGETFDLAAIGVRGPLLDDHLNGVVNIAANGIGLMDADGLPIMGAYDAAFFAIENFMYLGKTHGPWTTNLTAPKYSDGVYKVNSASFKRCQDYSAAALGGNGLRASWYPDTQKATTQAMGDLMRDLEFRMGFDRHGQLRAFLLDDTLDTSTWPRIIHEIDIFGDVEIVQGESRENVVTGICDWDPDFSKYRGERITVRNDVAIAKYRKGTSTGERPGDPIENAVINENAHLRWLLTRRATRLGPGMTVVTVVGKRGWLDPEYDVGSGVLLNTLDGTGVSGYVDRPCIVLRRKFSFDTQLETLTLWDVRDALIATAFTDGLSRIPYETDVEDDAFWETDDPDLAPLEMV